MPVTTTAVRIDVQRRMIRYAAGEIGPPEAVFLDANIDWRELSIIASRACRVSP
jgi:hypothetical protein